MALNHIDPPPPRQPLRLWPGVSLAVLLVLVRFGLPIVVPEAGLFGVIGAAVGAVAIVIWWLFFSRAPWPERLGAVALMSVGLLATSRIIHRSLATAGMGFLFPIYAIPAACLALVAWAVAARRLGDGARRATLALTLLLACAAWTLVRTGGIYGEGGSEFAWRWSATSEERLLARAAADPIAPAAVAAVDATAILWPGFRGPGRDGSLPGVRIATDWSASPPVEVWRRPIGPGWSSFAVGGGLLYTQEQRGDDEVVSAYRLTTGEPVWRHRDAVRFWEANAGPGPRATPTLSGGRVYSFGATGILNALAAGSGAVVWSRDAGLDTGTRVPTWGFASSPLMLGDLVVVAASGRLAAYDLATGEARWVGPDRGGSYSSPHLLTIDGVPQILLLNGTGAIGVDPAAGTLLWAHSWPTDSPILQPATTAGGDILIGSGFGNGSGTVRFTVGHGPAGWTTEARWTSIRLKPYFNDFVVHEGHAYGFDGGILACIDVEEGERVWKGGRYGHGQLLLLPDQDLLLVLSEEGELALVDATPDGFTELARFPAIEGKTWNHPVLVGDVLLVRNGQEMAAFRLTLASR